MKSDEEIMESLVRAWDLFTKTTLTHPDHLRYFRDGIHACQQVLMWRELQSEKPEKYLTQSEKSTNV